MGVVYLSASTHETGFGNVIKSKKCGSKVCINLLAKNNLVQLLKTLGFERTLMFLIAVTVHFNTCKFERTQLVTMDFISRGPRFETNCCRFEAWKFFLTLRCLSSL